MREQKYVCPHGGHTFRMETRQTTTGHMIAELEDYLQVTSDGRMLEWSDPGPGPGRWEKCEEYVPASFYVELLADAINRVREDMDSMENELTERACDMGEVSTRIEMLAERIEAVDRRLTEINEDAIARRVAQGERIEKLEQRIAGQANIETDRAYKVEALADRLAAVERGQAMRRENDGEVTVRMARIRERVSALEARQRDEAGEGEDHEVLGRMPHRTESEVRRETAREIVERLRARFCVGFSFGDIHYVADWIEREFGGE